MKLILTSVVVVLLIASVVGAQGQVEKGDKEIGFSGYLFSTVGIEGGGLSTGIFSLTYGYFFNDNLKLGAGPTLTISSVRVGPLKVSSTDLAATFFAQYNFETTGNSVPYISASWYQQSFSPDFGLSFTDYSFLTVGGGLRVFINEFVTMNTSVDYGFALSEHVEGGIILIHTGLSLLF